MKPSDFISLLEKNGVGFYTGVPDSLLANFCAFINLRQTNQNHVIATNEGEAIALATGFYLATGELPCVYMQNSGLGNIVNPLLSLCHKAVYSIPVVLLIGWRGEPGNPDEPQHLQQGRLTLELNQLLGIPAYVAGIDLTTQLITKIEELINLAKNELCPVAIVIKCGFFEQEVEWSPKNSYTLKRQEVIKEIVDFFNNAAIIATTGKIGRELYTIREVNTSGHGRDFLTVGSMGYASSIALGVAMHKPKVQVVCLDGDGAALMHMGSMVTNGNFASSNFKHIVLNNEAHESVGGQPTLAGKVSLTKIAESCGYNIHSAVSSDKELHSALTWLASVQGPAFLEILVSLESDADLGRPKEQPVVNKQAFMEFVQGF